MSSAQPYVTLDACTRLETPSGVPLISVSPSVALHRPITAAGDDASPTAQEMDDFDAERRQSYGTMASCSDELCCWCFLAGAVFFLTFA